MNIVYKYVILLVCVFHCLNTEAQKFDAIYIESIYEKLRSQLNVVNSSRINGFNLKVVDRGSIITNVGVDIPNIEYLNDSLLEAFAERKLLEIMLTKTQHELKNTLDHSKVKMQLNGADYNIGPLWDIQAGLEVVRSNNSISLVRDSLNYAIQWKNTNDEFSLIFPANIQIITGKDKVELEEEFESILIKQYDIHIDSTEMIDSTILVTQGDLYKKRGEYFIIENITNATYFLKGKDGILEVVYTPDHIIETFANMFYYPILGNNVRVNIQHHKYGNKKSNYSISLPQLIAFCKSNGLKTYVGIEQNNDDLLEATVILHSKKYNFIHLLHVKTNTETLMSSKNAEIYCRLYSYITTDNISDIFSIDTNNKPKTSR